MNDEVSTGVRAPLSKRIMTIPTHVLATARARGNWLPDSRVDFDATGSAPDVSYYLTAGT